MDGWKERERGEGRNEVQRSPDFECRVISNAQRQRHDTAKRDVNGLVQASMTILLYPGRMSTGCLYLERPTTNEQKRLRGSLEGSPQGGWATVVECMRAGRESTLTLLKACKSAIQRSSDPVNDECLQKSSLPSSPPTLEPTALHLMNAWAGNEQVRAQGCRRRRRPPSAIRTPLPRGGRG